MVYLHCDILHAMKGSLRIWFLYHHTYHGYSLYNCYVGTRIIKSITNLDFKKNEAEMLSSFRRNFYLNPKYILNVSSMHMYVLGFL